MTADRTGALFLTLCGLCGLFDYLPVAVGVFTGGLDSSTLFYDLATALAVGVASVAFCSAGCFLGILDLSTACMIGSIQFSIGSAANTSIAPKTTAANVKLLIFFIFRILSIYKFDLFLSFFII